jgi:hypothetical protein
MSHILIERPLSGSYEEHKFSATGSCLWILFTPENGEDWVGVFGRGDVVNDVLVISGDSSFTLVVAGGNPIVVDEWSKQALYSIEKGFIQSAFPIPNFAGILASDFTHLYIFGKNAIIWQSNRISLDGIVISSITKEIITGTVQGFNESADFTLTVGDWKYKSSFECPKEIGG